MIDGRCGGRKGMDEDNKGTALSAPSRTPLN